jgi:uncharacterized delta-60 repeat protein
VDSFQMPYMNKQIRTVLHNACRAAPAVLAFGMLSPTTMAATGDLDPGFADIGRLVLPDFLGPAFSVEAQDDNIILAGGKLVPQFGENRDAFGFARRLSGTAAIDATFAAAGLDDLMVVDLVVQPDGTIVGVGRRSSERDAVSVAFRLQRDGALDTGFGQDGVVELTGITDVRSAAVDPGGAVVIAASSTPGEMPRAALVVLRLLSTGSLDDSFGTAGYFSISAGEEMFYIPSQILSAENGGYRIAVNEDILGFHGCRVLALTASGTRDWDAEIDAEGRCNSMVEQTDGRLLIAGFDNAGPLVARLLANGDVDPTFAAQLPADTSLRVATDIAVDTNTGSIIVVLDDFGNPRDPGLVVARLQADGALDPLFGEGGVTWVDLPELDGNAVSANPGDVTVLDNSDVLVSGGSATAFVARLVGGSGNDSPGVLGVRNIRVDTTEDAREAIVTVRRMGGKVGSVSAAYEAHATSDDVFHAVEGDDFTAVSGRLDWADGDGADKQIVVPIAPDAGSPEETEQFAVTLSDVQGGAGTGTLETTVSIETDAPPAGMFTIVQSEIHVGESKYAQVSISRDYYYAGAVSVTATLSSGTATLGEDFRDESVTLSWADGSYGSEYVFIRIYKDTIDEPQEQFTLQLSDATGGAVIGSRSTATIFIADNDEPAPPPPPPPPPPPGGGGGGGPVGFVSLLLLGLVRLFARMWETG